MVAAALFLSAFGVVRITLFVAAPPSDAPMDTADVQTRPRGFLVDLHTRIATSASAWRDRGGVRGIRKSTVAPTVRVAWAPKQAGTLCQDDSVLRVPVCRMCPILDTIATSLAECKTQCAVDPECNSVNYNVGKQRCKTYANCTVLASDTELIFGWLSNLSYRVTTDGGAGKETRLGWLERDFRPGMSMLEARSAKHGAIDLVHENAVTQVSSRQYAVSSPKILRLIRKHLQNSIELFIGIPPFCDR